MKLLQRSSNASGVTGFIDDSAGPATSYETLFALNDEGRLSLRAGFRVRPGRPATVGLLRIADGLPGAARAR